MGQEFGLVSGHVDVHRAIAFASLAGEAEVESLLDVLVAPALCDHIAVQHFPQMVRTAASCVTLLVCHHEAGTHGVVVSFVDVLPAALANSHAPQRGMGETPVVFGEFEVRFGIPWAIVSTKAKVLVDAERIHNLSRIHLPLWIPDGFELAKGLDQLAAEHLFEEFRAALAVTMFSA